VIKVLVADDDVAFRRMVEMLLAQQGLEVLTASDGEAAWRMLQEAPEPLVALLDWMMPGLDGVEICRRVRAAAGLPPRHILLLTARRQQADIVAGLEAGANDFVTKPFEPEELLARVRVGVRVVELQSELTRRVRELEDALAQIKTLRGLLPICCYCKKIRDDQNYWEQVESYITKHSGAEFTHGICPDCYEKHVVPSLAELESRVAADRKAAAKKSRKPSGKEKQE